MVCCVSRLPPSVGGQSCYWTGPIHPTWAANVSCVSGQCALIWASQLMLSSVTSAWLTANVSKTLNDMTSRCQHQADDAMAQVLVEMIMTLMTAASVDQFRLQMLCTLWLLTVLRCHALPPMELSIYQEPGHQVFWSSDISNKSPPSLEVRYKEVLLYRYLMTVFIENCHSIQACIEQFVVVRKWRHVGQVMTIVYVVCRWWRKARRRGLTWLTCVLLAATQSTESHRFTRISSRVPR